MKRKLLIPFCFFLLILPGFAQEADPGFQLSLRRYAKGLDLIRGLNEKLLELELHFQMLAQAFPETDNDPCGMVSRDLHYIQREIELLQLNIQYLKKDLEELFLHYTRFLNYSETLQVCREQDDWEQFDTYLSGTQISALHKGEAAALRFHINLEFSVDRLLAFLERYQTVIRLGNVSFLHFGCILEALQEEAEVTEIRQIISRSGRSFEATYHLAEMEGSQLKDLLYGY